MYIGIDLGTSNSTVAGIEDGKARVFRPADGGEALPSVIYIDKRGHRLYGRRAYDQALITPENVAAGFKRLMGTATPIKIASIDAELTPEECSADIIRQLIGQAATETGLDSFEGAVIAIPASFNQMQSEATLRAAKEAGLEKVDLIQEPIAAALAAMADAKRDGKFIVYDLGGGTFDLSILQAEKGQISIIAQQGVNMLGGRDFDRMIVSEIVRPWLTANFDLPGSFFRDPLYYRLVRIATLAAEKAKIDLSSLEMAAIFASDDEIRLMDQSETEIFLDAPITRSQFEDLIREPIEQTIALIKTTLKENDLEPAEIDRIVFIGGPSRIPLVRRMVTEALGIEADLKTDPMTAVAEGAAYYSETRAWGNAPKESPAPTSTEPVEAKESVPKETEGHATVEGEPDLFFDFDLRTPNDMATLSVHVEGNGGNRQINITNDSWKSQTMDLVDKLEIALPLDIIGENVFDVHVLNSSGEEIAKHTQQLTVTRLVAQAMEVPAAHSIAVKVRAGEAAAENSFVYLVRKGDKLPTEGQLKLKSATTLQAGSTNALGFEVFQVEFPERIEVNLCVGFFRVEGSDLPEGEEIKAGDPIVFDWRMNEGGILQVSVKLPEQKIELEAPRFYAPQAGQISYEGTSGQALTKSILHRAKEEWGDLAAAVGPLENADITFLKTRIDEQIEILRESSDEAEIMRQISEEGRFIRQDIAKLGLKYAAPLMQRHVGKIIFAFNRVCRSIAATEEEKAFDQLATTVQGIIDAGIPSQFYKGQLCLSEMRRIFFKVAWRSEAYVKAWFSKLSSESWLFANQVAFQALVKKGQTHNNDLDALRATVMELNNSRVTISTSDAVNDLATIIKG